MIKRAFSKLKLEHVVIAKGQFHQDGAKPNTLEDSELLSLLREEENEEDKLVQTDISDTDLLRVLDRSGMVSASSNDSESGIALTSPLPLRGPGWEVVVGAKSGGGVMSSYCHRLHIQRGQIYPREPLLMSPSAGGRYEARLWLCNTISCIHSVSPRDQRDLFLTLLQSKLSEQDVAAQLLHMIFEKAPEKAGGILAKKCYMLENFFDGNSKRILQWFDNFSIDSESGHKKGARAISQYAFVNRDTCWEELEWKGKHGQSPAVVATKPHYFQDLDILQTVENFLEYVPDFWSSEELADSVKDGEILRIDTKYFIEQFIWLMYEENLDQLWTVIEEFLIEEHFSYLCQRLLIMLDEHRLLAFVRSVGKFIRANAQCKDFVHPSCWLENLLLTCNDPFSLDELLLLNAVISQGRQLLRLMDDEEYTEAKSNMAEILETASTFSDADHWALLKHCAKMKPQLSLKWIGLQSWVCHYRLLTECKIPQSWESLFSRNVIGFQKADDYSLVRSDGALVGCGSDSDDTAKIHYKNRKRDRKRRRKKYSHSESSANETSEFQTSTEWQGLHSVGRSWLLSTDGYSCVWHSADLPEHLSGHCFSTWMKWVCSKW